jgi:hypothetical protein
VPSKEGSPEDNTGEKAMFMLNEYLPGGKDESKTQKAVPEAERRQDKKELRKLEHDRYAGIHFTYFPPSRGFSKCGVTVAWSRKKPELGILVAVAICCEGDIYSRPEGRKLSAERLLMLEASHSDPFMATQIKGWPDFTFRLSVSNVLQRSGLFVNPKFISTEVTVADLAEMAVTRIIREIIFGTLDSYSSLKRATPTRAPGLPHQLRNALRRAGYFGNNGDVF